MRSCLALIYSTLMILVAGAVTAGPLEQAPGMPAAMTPNGIINQRDYWRTPAPTVNQTTTIALKRYGAVWTVPIIINNTPPVPAILDSGSGHMVINEDIFARLQKTGAIEELGMVDQKTADGSQRPWKLIRIRSLTVGRIAVAGIEAMVSPPGAYNLVGQSFLERFKSWSVDNVRHELILGEMITPATAQGSAAQR